MAIFWSISYIVVILGCSLIDSGCSQTTRNADNCEINIRTTACCYPPHRCCSKITKSVGAGDLFTLLYGTDVTISTTTTYGVYVYELCEATERIENLNFSHVMESGHKCEAHEGMAGSVEFSGCDKYLTKDGTNFILYAFSSANQSSCMPQYHFVYIDYSKPPLADRCSCTDSAMHCERTNDIMCTYECVCNDGYNTVDGQHGRVCIDIDECLENPCSGISDCINTVGSYMCECTDGYTMSVNGTCEDINECLDDSRCVGEHRFCKNLQGSYSCDCDDGFTAQGNICEDVDECETAGLCGEFSKCTNNPGSFNCSCLAGFTGIGSNCTDIDECLLEGVCDNGICSNTNGSYSCICKEGFQFNSRNNCTDINECSALSPCGAHSQCINIHGSFGCFCQYGYQEDDNGTCQDVDECSTNTHRCDDQSQVCVNYDGNYRCDCRLGYIQNGNFCVDINECLDPGICSPNALCINYNGGHNCTCRTGFTDTGGSCSDVNECADSIFRCGENGDCMNTAGSYSCDCHRGYQQTGSNGCEDIDECSSSVSLCGANHTCINSPGNFSCPCSTGYQESQEGICEDINECNRGITCGVHGTCENFAGGYRCNCATGYEPNGSVCIDTNECLDPGVCGTNALCINYNGGHNCTCKTGFTDTGGICSDINECESGVSCGNHSKCINMKGNYSCQCLQGYTGNKDGHCTDIDECVAEERACGEHEDCGNTLGSFQCSCSLGYTGSVGMCIDIDECLLESDLCGPNTDCLNTNGSYSCPCSHGYTLQNGSCKDVNECADSIFRCGENGDCMNTAGSYSCDCHRGYQQTGSNGCEDIDECSSGISSCGANHTCINSPGNFSCPCSTGYEESQEGICEDINECNEGITCGVHGTCENFAGGYRCNCVTGYEQNGSTCIDADECLEDGVCGANSVCSNTNGSYNCSCKDGFLQRNGSCLSSDPCRRQIGGDPICPGKFEECSADPEDSLMPVCRCNTGYERRRGNGECVITLDEISREMNNLLAHEITLGNLDEALDLMRELSETPVGLLNSTQRSQTIILLSRTTNFLANLQEKCPINKTIWIVDLFNHILTTTNTTSDYGDSWQILINSTEAYGKFLVNAVGPGDSLDRLRENIIVMAELVPVTGQDYVFPPSNKTGGSLEGMASVTLPKELLMENSKDGMVGVANIIISNIEDFFLPNETSNRPTSVVLSSQVGRSKTTDDSASPTLSAHPVKLSFDIIRNTSELSSAELECVFLNLTTRQWSSKGVETVVTGDGRGVHCKSDHLTSFAILLNIRGNIDTVNSKVLQIITNIGLSISLICLALTIIFFIGHGKQLLQQVHYFVHLNLSISLFLAYGLFAFQDFAIGQQIPCTVITALLNYLFLSVFCWMLCEGVMLYLLLVVVFSTLSKRWWFFLLLGWGPPLPIAAVTYGVFHKDYVIEEYKACWLASSDGSYTILMFAVPAAIIIVLNTVFLVMVARSLFKNIKGGKSKLKKQQSLVSTQTKALVILLPLIGLTWVFGFVLVNNDDVILFFGILSSILNSLQGLFIFVFHVLRSSKVMGRIEKKLGLRSTTKSNYTSTNNSHYSTAPIGERFGAKMSMKMSTTVVRPSPTTPEDVESGIGIEEEKSASHSPDSTPPPQLPPSSPTPPPPPAQTPPPHSPTPPPPAQTPPPHSPPPATPTLSLRSLTPPVLQPTPPTPPQQSRTPPPPSSPPKPAFLQRAHTFDEEPNEPNETNEPNEPVKHELKYFRGNWSYGR